MSGDYELGRIDGDSSNGYEVWPSQSYIVKLMTEGIKHLRYQPRLIEKLSEMISSAKTECDEFIESMALNEMEIIYDRDGVMIEVRPKNWPEY
jgi:hypothetical protein